MRNMDEVLRDILSKQIGNIIEIGAGIGETTKLLLYTAKEYGVKVVVIDPHELGWDEMPESYGRPYPYQQFIENTNEYKDFMIHIREASQNEGMTEKLMQFKPIVFSFVDGLQYKDAVLSDLNMMKKLDCSCICVDDYTRLTSISEVPLAIEQFLKDNNDYELIHEDVDSRAKAFLIKKTYEN